VPTWRKVRPVRSAEFVIGGCTKGKGARELLGALLLGYWKNGLLEYAGHVGSGLDEAAVAQLTRRTRELTRKSSPFAEKPPIHRPTTWLEPRLVAEVNFSDWTPAGLLRAPVFARLRDDIPPESIGRPEETESAGGASQEAASSQTASSRRASRKGTSSKVTSSKAISPSALSKATSFKATGDGVDGVLQQLAGTGARLDLAAVSRFMLPHLQDRPLTMIRMPEGIGGERFYQKHWEQELPQYVETIPIFTDHRGANERYILVNNLPTLLWLGQSGTLEFHVWHSRADVAGDGEGLGSDYASSREALEHSELNYPDFLVFDIDPYIYSGKEPQGAEPELNEKGFAAGKKVAFWLRALLQEMGLRAIVKTSGKTGLH